MNRWMLGMVLVMLPLGASAAEVFLENETRLAAPDAISPDLMACQVPARLPQAVEAYAANVSLVDTDTEAGRFLDLRITEVRSGSGLFGKKRWIEVTGTLREGGEEFRSFRAKRASTSLFSDDCTTLGKVTVVLAQDIAGWLSNYATAPSLLGDAE